MVAAVAQSIMDEAFGRFALYAGSAAYPHLEETAGRSTSAQYIPVSGVWGLGPSSTSYAAAAASAARAGAETLYTHVDPNIPGGGLCRKRKRVSRPGIELSASKDVLTTALASLLV